MLTVLCFKWNGYRGSEYDARAVNIMRSMLSRNLTIEHELVCCTDDPKGIDPRVRAVPLPNAATALGERYPKLYAFHPDGGELFGRRVMMLDLDMVIVQNIDALASRSEPFVAAESPGWPGCHFRFNTTFALFNGGAHPAIWTKFDLGQSRARIAQIRQNGLGGTDQHWVSYILDNQGGGIPHSGAEFETFKDLPDPAVLPETTRIVTFGGKDNPRHMACQRRAPWIKEHWR